MYWRGEEGVLTLGRDAPPCCLVGEEGGAGQELTVSGRIWRMCDWLSSVKEHEQYNRIPAIPSRILFNYHTASPLT